MTACTVLRALKFVDFRVIEQADGVFAFYVMQVSFHVAEADALQAASFVTSRTVFKTLRFLPMMRALLTRTFARREQGLIIFLAKWLQKLKLLYNLLPGIPDGQDSVIGQLRNQILIGQAAVFIEALP